MKRLKALFSITPFKLSAVITLVFAVISFLYDINPSLFTVIEAISEKSIDFKFKLRGYEKPKSKIIIVAGDEKSFQKFGQWPFDRATVFAPLLKTLCQLNPKAVGLDIVWAESERMVPAGIKSALASRYKTTPKTLEELFFENSGDATLKKAIEACGPKLVMGYALSRDPIEGSEQEEFDRRLQVITSVPSNAPSTLMRGPIRFKNTQADRNGNVDFYFVGRSGILNNPSIVPKNTAQGFFNSHQDSDGNYRHGIMLWRAGLYFVPSISLRMAQKALSNEDSPPTVFMQPFLPEKKLTQEFKLTLNTTEGPRPVPMDLTGKVIVNYRGPNATFANVSMADVVNSDEAIEADVTDVDGEHKKVKYHKTDFFKDSLVLVGITAMALYDIRPRPFDGTAYGVENHANILDNILNDDFITKPKSSMLMWIMPLIIAISLLYGWAITKLDARLGAAFGIVAIGGLLYFDQFYLFNKQRILFSGHLQAIQFFFQFLGITVLKYIQEESEKKFIRSAFDKYVSPAVINSMLKDPGKLRLGGEKKELSVLFSDIRGFTELSERVDVKALTQFLNEYLGAMTDILQGNSGTLDKYIGDAVMGFWGAPIDLPNHANLSVKTAVEMLGKLDELNASFKQKYGLTIDIGIGINSGAVSVGNFGSSKVFEYTVIGDNVNLASRLEGINKYYGTRIIISETTYAYLKQGEFLTREIDTVKVKGKKKPVKIYEVFPDNGNYAGLKSALGDFNQGLAAYYSRQWDAALSAFEKVIQKRSEDKPTLGMIERCQYYKENPPPNDWDGSWEMTSK